MPIATPPRMSHPHRGWRRPRARPRRLCRPRHAERCRVGEHPRLAPRVTDCQHRVHHGSNSSLQGAHRRRAQNHTHSRPHRRRRRLRLSALAGCIRHPRNLVLDPLSNGARQRQRGNFAHRSCHRREHGREGVVAYRRGSCSGFVAGWCEVDWGGFAMFNEFEAPSVPWRKKHVPCAP